MKYYTPELEEFHVGFEYEEYSQGYQYDVKLLTENPEVQLQILSEPELVTGWVKCVYELDRFISLIDGEISTHLPEVRVKYLDEQDIEELGWTLEKTIKSGLRHTEKRFVFEDMYLSFYPDINHCTIHNGKENYFESWGYFNGTIKNKSELRKLMTQIGI